MNEVYEQVERITEVVDDSEETLTVAERLAAFAVRNLTGKRRRLALALAGALADYAEYDAKHGPVGDDR